MQKTQSRNRRIADQIQRELSELIRLELRDPRVRMVTLTDVEVAADNSHAKVFFTTFGNDAQIQSCSHGLERAAGFLRSQLASRLSIRTVPSLHFEFDASIDRGMRLSKLIDDAIADDAKHAGEEE